jgi:cytidylate kinase
MTLIQPRTMERLVEDQARRWNLPRARPAGEPSPPLVTVSRQHGAGGSEVARRLCDDLRLDLVDQAIIREIAAKAHVSERAIQELDEKDRETLTEWLMALAEPRHLDPSGYHSHLTHLIRAIARTGGAVIVGRGAHLILTAQEALRVMVVAPLEARIARVRQREGLSEREARDRILHVEAEREAFLRRHFHAGFSDPTLFDLVVNAGDMGVDGAVATIEAALARRPARPTSL